MPKKNVKGQTSHKLTSAELTEALKRERADAVNLRRQYEEQITRLRSLVKANVVQELLPVIDNFERALKHVPKDLINNDYVKGVNGIMNQFEQTLRNMGVEKIKTVGEHFNPHLHEAVSVEGDGDSLDSEEVIAAEVQAGYKIGDDIIRHAMVKVKRQGASKPLGEERSK